MTRLHSLLFACFATIALVAPGLYAADSDTVLNNGAMRMGDGSSPSINGFGTLQQPFYNQGGSWNKLTYSTYPLKQSFGVGGDGTTDWNLNGSLAHQPSMSSQSFDASGMTYTSGNVGHGTLVVSGSYTVGATVLNVEHSYLLAENSNYLKVTTTITNNSGAAITNLRYWVGTDDDWVGSSDDPTEERGSIETGSFVRNDTSSQRAPALLVTSLAEGVLFFSPHDKANTLSSSMISWSGADSVTGTDPDTSPVSVSGDNGYGLFVRLSDLANGASDSFTWYYAADATAELNAVISEVASAASAVSGITDTGATLTASSSVGGTGYWLVVAAGAATPTASQIKAGTDFGGTIVIANGSSAITANTDTDFVIGGLSPATNYAVHFVGHNDLDGYSDTTSASFTTAKGTPLVSVDPTAAGITYGETLNDATLSGGTATYGGSAVSGSFAFSSPATQPDAGTAGHEVTFTPTDGTTYATAITTVSVTTATRTLPITGLSGVGRTYNGSTAASASGTAALSGVLSGDAVSLGGTPAFTFASADVGTAITITTSGYTLGGTDAGNYSLQQPALTADITTRSLTLSADQVDKPYGTALSDGSGHTAFTATGLAGSETVGSVSVVYGNGAGETDAMDTYSGSVVISAASGGTFDPANYQITYQPGDLVVTTIPLTVTLDPGGGAPLDPGTVSVNLGASYGTLPSPTRTGHLFAGWFTQAGAPVDSGTTVEITTDHTLKAGWTLQPLVTLAGYQAPDLQVLKASSDEATLIETTADGDGNPQFRFEVSADKSSVLIRFALSPALKADG